MKTVIVAAAIALTAFACASETEEANEPASEQVQQPLCVACTSDADCTGGKLVCGNGTICNKQGRCANPPKKH